MRWVKIREAKIDSMFREMFEQYGLVAMQLAAVSEATFKYRGQDVTFQDYGVSLMPWLTEQYDKADRKETWSMTMEAAITVFVLAELVISLIRWWSRLP